MSQTYRALLVGTGGIADSHARAIEDSRGRVQLIGAVDVDVAKVRAFCGRHKIAAVHTDYATALGVTFLALLVRGYDWELPSQNLEYNWQKLPPEPRDGLRVRLRTKTMSP